MMKKLILTFFFFASVVFAQAPVDKLSAALKMKLIEAGNDQILVWVYFKDKGLNKDTYFNNPLLVVSEKSLQRDRKSTRLNSSHVKISYAVFCLKKKI